ncbi:hypothetical protein BH11PLA1_BH11PLA1_23340 [soil metagenome]
MNTLDRYIAKQYLLNIALLLMILFAFVFMIDASLNMQRFVETAVRTAKADGGAEPSGVRRFLAGALLAADLWWPRFLQLYNFVIGLVLVGAMGFTFSQLVRHRELVAVLASGVSLFRIMRPVLLVALLMLGLQVINQEYVIPHIKHLIVRDNTQAAQRTLKEFPVRLREDGQGRVFYADRFDPETATLTNLEVWERDAQGKPLRRISAPRAVFDENQKVWRLQGGVTRTLAVGGGGLNAAAPGEATQTLRSDLDPTGLVALEYQSYAQLLSWRQIGNLMESPTLRPDVKEQLSRIAWGRAANYLCVVLSLVVAIPFFLTREPRNMVLQSIKCAPVALGSLVGSTLAILAPIPGIPVEAAVFVPVLALIPSAIYFVTGVKT